MPSITETPRGERMTSILMLLLRNQRRKFSVVDILNHLNESEPVILRNVQRDCKALAERYNDVIAVERQNGKLVYSVHSDMRGKVSLPIKRNGLLAFFLLKRLQPFFAKSARTLKDLSEVITDRTKESDYELFDDLDGQLESSTFLFGEQSSLAIDGNLFNDLLTSLLHKRKLKILYEKGDSVKPVSKTICPAKLILFKGELYFVCISEYQEDWDFFIKLCRISSAEICDETFTVDPKRIERIEKRLINSFGIYDETVPKPQKIIVQFPASPYYQRIFTEKSFHQSQKISTDKKGHLIVTMNVPVGLDLINWVLSWPDSVVKGPKELIEEMRVVARTLIKKYGE